MLLRTSFIAASIAYALLPTNVQAQGATSEVEIEKIIVTGQKLKRSLLETKESVSVITSDYIEANPVLEIDDLYDVTPNVFSLSAGERFGLRGISQDAASTGGGSGDLGVIYIDGVSYTGFASRFNSKDTWDIKQVEILRGPQSTNVGRNALIGAVVVSTNQPELNDNYGRVRIGAGNFGRQIYSGTANLAVTDHSAFRIAGQYSKTDGYIDNVTLGIDDFDARDNTNLRGQYRVEFNDKLNANLLVGYIDTSRGQDVYRADLQPSDSFNSSANLQADEDYEALTTALTIEYDITDNLTLTSLTSFLEGDYFRFDDDDEGPEGGSFFRGREVDEQNLIQELRLNYQSEKIRGVVGTFYNRIESDNLTIGSNAIVPADVGVPSALLAFYPERFELDTSRQVDDEVENLAFFTEWEFDLSEQWTLSLGGRLDSEEQTILDNTTNTLSAATPLPDPAQAAALAELLMPGLGPIVQGGVTQVNQALLAAVAPTNNPETSFDFSEFIPQVGVTYQINKNQGLSVFYKEGYRSGGVQVNTSGRRSDFDAESIDNFELAYRSSWFDNRVTFNGNLYYGDWQNQQVTVCLNGNVFDCVIQNVGESEIYGIELESRFQVSDDLQLFASLGLSETEFTDFVSSLDGDLTGNEFAFSPDTNASVGGSYYISDHWRVSGNINYLAGGFNDVQNRDEIDSRTLINLSVAYQHEQFSVDFYVTNLTNKFYRVSNFTNLNTDENLVRGGVPREFGINFNYFFE